MAVAAGLLVGYAIWQQPSGLDRVGIGGQPPEWYNERVQEMEEEADQWFEDRSREMYIDCIEDCQQTFDRSEEFCQEHCNIGVE